MRMFCILFYLVLFSACSEQFKTEDPTEFNNKIANRTDIISAEELIKIYYNYPAEEGDPKLEISSKEISDGRIEVQLIDDFQQDDSVKATKIIMTVGLEKGIWHVYFIKTNFKCYEGRGHTDWGTEWCS